MRSERIWLCLAAMTWCCAVVVRAEDHETAATQPIAQADENNAAAAEVAKSTGKGKAQLSEVVVEAKKPVSSASSDEVREKDYAVRPHDTVFEILNNVPGLVVAQHQGGGKAPQWLIRGFDADHGTDFAVSVDNLPVNLPTHAHGQGYADINFIIPETIDHFQLWKGPYFAQLGDFANAGALNFVTKDEFKENFALAEGGSFGTQRYVLGASPKLSWAKTLLAAQAYYTNGPFENPQHYSRYNIFGKLTFEPTAQSKGSISATVFQGDWGGSGQIPLREIQAGRLDRFGSEDPTEGGHTDRENLDAHYTYTPTAEDEWTFQVYGSRYKLQLFTDFTFFRDTGLRFTRLANGDICDTTHSDCGGSDNFIPGDGIEQNDERLLYGGWAKYARYWSVANVPMQTQIAVETRNDDINVALHRQVQRQRFYTINQLNVEERTMSAYLQQQVFFADWMRLEAGLRGDVFFFDGQNQLPSSELKPNGEVDETRDPNFTATRIAGNSTNLIVSPKGNIIITPVTDTDIYLNFGNGFHSNDARNVLLAKSNPQQAENTTAALARSTGYELGARTRQFDRLDVAAALWLLDLGSELVFSGDAGNGNFVPSGPTRRWGVDFETRYQFTDWLFFDYDLSWADPRFKNGDAIALAPTLLMNGGLTTEFGKGFSAALRMRYLGDRPANEDRTLTARGYTLLDLIGRYRWRNIEAQLSLLNLTDTDWREAQFDDQSCVRGDINNAAHPECRNSSPNKQGSASANAGVDDIHFTPGNPFWARGGITVFF